MSIVVKCDRCNKELGEEDERVILTATKYTLFDPDNPPPTTTVPALDASQPPGQIAPPAVAPASQPFPTRLMGSSKDFVAQAAFDGQLEMHLACWEEWFDSDK